jgi:hypothetical protein
MAPTASSKELIQRVPRIPVLDPIKYGYTFKDILNPTSDVGAIQSVSKNGVLCDVLGVRPEENMMAVMQACNSVDVSTDKIKLRGIIFGDWMNVTP